MKWNVRYLEEAYCDLKNLDNSIQKLVVKAIRKVSQNPLPNNEGGYGKPLSNQKDSKLAGLLKIKLLKAGIRIVYRLEIKDGRFLIHFVGKEFPVDALSECKLLAFPINVEEEWKLEKMTGQSRLNNGQSYLDFDVVLATTPKKPSSVKKQETEIDAWLRGNSKKYDELRNHQYIGTSLSSFLSKWPHAKLVNTTINGGVKIEIYHLQDYMFDYQIIFRNGKCISQTKL